MFWDSHVGVGSYINWLGVSIPSGSKPIDFPLWFLRDLIVISALAPFIYWYVKSTRIYGLLLLALAYFSGVWPNIIGFSITAVFFFSIGTYFAVFGKNLVVEFRRVRLLSYALALLMLLVSIWFHGSRTSLLLYIICGVCAAFNIASDLLVKGKTKVIPVLLQSTFVIYALHSILVLSVVGFILKPLELSDNLALMSVAYLVRPFLAVAICIGVFLILRRWFPKILGVLTGIRG